MADRLEPRPFEVSAGGVRLAGEEVGEGPPLILLHGLTATRRYVLHGSVALGRRGYRLISYDARGHGESEPAESYGYEVLAEDLGAVIADRCPGERPVLCGHSMGCHTAMHYTLEHPEVPAALVLISPAALGLPTTSEVLAYWDRLADGLAEGGVEGFVSAYERDLDLDSAWRETVVRITRDRLARHDHPEAVADALRQVPRSIAFDGLDELRGVDVPALVVASHDDADPSHPYAIAEAWVDALPRAQLISEERGKSPLAWQGGRLSRAIADFLEEPAVRERLS
jgi:pimeloyl-ACP methyl ester carboxylesterase